MVPLFAVSSEAHLTRTPARVVDTVDLGMVEPPGSRRVPEGKEINR